MAGKDPVISTTSPEPLGEHSAYFDAQAKRDAAIRLVMSEKGVTWPEAVKIVDGTPDSPDPLAARVATLEAAVRQLSQDLSDEKNAVTELAHLLQARIDALSQASEAAPGSVQ